MDTYTEEYINEKMEDFLEFRTALRDAGHLFRQETEVLLYHEFRRG